MSNTLYGTMIHGYYSVCPFTKENDTYWQNYDSVMK